MKQRYSALYEPLKCLTCNNAEETYSHMWNCSGNKDQVIELVESVTTSIFNQFKDDFNVIPERVTIPQLIDILSPDDIPDFLPDLARGFTIKPFELVIKRLLFAGSKAKTIIRSISNELRRQFRTLIWLPRCKNLTKKEKALGITKKTKRNSPFVDFPDELKCSPEQSL